MKGKYIFLVILLLPLVILVVAVTLAHGHTFALLEPSGILASKERELMILAAALMLLVVLPVFALTFVVAWRYRAGNTKARYTPNWEHNRTEEFVWWAVPSVIIAVLAVVTWTSTHALDPYKPLDSSTPPLTVQVVALNWKWLFIYPAQHIATVNYLEVPAGTPINFEITADAPMNSFWIPQLSGQVYAMTGMVTQLRVMADAPGTYSGGSANFSGEGFSGMQFPAKAVSSADFDAWAASVQRAPQQLDEAAYVALAAPSKDVPMTLYASTTPDLFSTIVEKYMSPTHMSAMPEMAN